MNVTKRILIIHDHEELRGFLAKRLESAGFLVKHFGRGTEGISALEKDDYCLIVLDYDLREDQGRDARYYLPKLAKVAPRTPVVIITAHGREEVEPLQGVKEWIFFEDEKDLWGTLPSRLAGLCR